MQSHGAHTHLLAKTIMELRLLNNGPTPTVSKWLYYIFFTKLNFNCSNTVELLSREITMKIPQESQPLVHKGQTWNRTTKGTLNTNMF